MHNMPLPWQVTTLEQNGHCGYCGAAYPRHSPWPRTCTVCGETTWRNPLPVGLALLPVRMPDGGPDGLIVVRRDIQPARGELCLPGGLIIPLFLLFTAFSRFAFFRACRRGWTR